MKKLLLILLCSPILIGCVHYPKNYTYSPSVSVGGNSEVIDLPEPFSKGFKPGKPPKNVTIINQSNPQQTHSSQPLSLSPQQPPTVNYFLSSEYISSGYMPVPVVNLDPRSSLATYIIP
jgi:hypothetical protein